MSKLLPIFTVFFSFTLFADPNSDLEAALWAKDIGRVTAALRAGADVHYEDSQGQNWLHLAVIAEFEDAIAVLIAAGVPVDELDRSRSSALHIAASNGNLRGVTRLLGQGANPLIQNNGGLLPVDLARLQHFEVIAGRLEQRQQEVAQAAPAQPPRPRPSLLRRVFCCGSSSAHSAN